MDAAPEGLGQVEDRLALFDKLKRKYGASVDEVIAYGEEVTRKLDEVENREEIVAKLKKELAAAADAYLVTARAVSKKRHTTAPELQKLVEAEINPPAIDSPFKIEVTRDAQPAFCTTA